jgi:hypothetical protein
MSKMNEMNEMYEKKTTRIEENKHLGSNSNPPVTDHRSTASTPRWIKLFGIIALVIILLFVVLHLTGNNPFGHMGHMGHISNGLDNHILPIEYRVL